MLCRLRQDKHHSNAQEQLQLHLNRNENHNSPQQYHQSHQV